MKVKPKIHINCGECKLYKGCKIKLDFRSIIKKYEFEKPFNFADVFELKCPKKENKYKEGDEVIFSIGYGAHNVRTKIYCERDCDYCDRCRNKKPLYLGNKRYFDSEITFRNKRYKGFVEIKGIILGYVNKGKYVISVTEYELNRIKPNLNRYDQLFIKSISDKMKTYCPFPFEYEFIFVSKRKFIN